MTNIVSNLAQANELLMRLTGGIQDEESQDDEYEEEFQDDEEIQYINEEFPYSSENLVGLYKSKPPQYSAGAPRTSLDTKPGIDEVYRLLIEPIKEAGLKLMLVTCNLDTSITLREAWADAQRLRIETLLALKDISLFTFSTIEYHHSVKDRAFNGVYQSKTMTEFEEELLTEKVSNTDTMSTLDVIRRVYNFWKDMRYLSNMSGRDQTLKVHVEDQERYYSYMFQDLIHEVIEHDPTDQELFIASIHHPSVLGYPHLHVVVCCNNSTDATKQISSAMRSIKERTGYLDVDVSTRPQAHKNKRQNAITYVLKNYKSEFVNKVLHKYSPDNTDIIVAIVNKNNTFSRRLDSTYNQYFKERLLSLFDVPNSYVKTPQFKAFYMTLYEEIERQDVIASNCEALLARLPPSTERTDEEVQRIINEEQHVNPELNPLNRLIQLLNEFMLKHNLVVNENVILKRIPGSYMSYSTAIYDSKVVGNPEQLFDMFTAEEGLLVSSCKWKQKIMTLFKNANNPFREFFKKNVVQFPTINIDYFMLELRDGFFNIITRTFYRTQDKYACYGYYPQMTIENVVPNLKIFMEHFEWPKLTRNLGLYNQDDLHKTYENLLPNYPKKKIISIVGPSNAGKTLWVSTFKHLYPPGKMGTIEGDVDEFDMCYQAEDKLQLYIDEANKLLSNTSCRGMLLKLIGCERIKAVRKHGAEYFIDQIPNIFMTSNPLPGDIKYLNDEAMVNRIFFMHIKESMADHVPNLESKLEAEVPFILVLLSMCYDKKIDNLDHYRMPLIKTTFDQNDIDYIERMKSGKRQEQPKSFEDMLKMYEHNNKGIENLIKSSANEQDNVSRKFESTHLPSDKTTSQAHVLANIKSTIQL